MGRQKKGHEALLKNRGVLERRCRLDGRGSDQIGVWALQIARSELNSLPHLTEAKFSSNEQSEP
jgi:hypothetical protein